MFLENFPRGFRCELEILNEALRLFFIFLGNFPRGLGVNFRPSSEALKKF